MTLEPKIALRLQLLRSALQTGHGFVLTLIAIANKMCVEIERLGWA